MCWPSGGGGGASSLVIEQRVGYGSYYVQNSVRGNGYPPTADLPYRGWNQSGDEKHGIFFPVDHRLDATQDVDIRWHGDQVNSASQAGNRTMEFKARWLGNDESGNVAFVNAGVTVVIATTVQDRAIYESDFVTLNPDGTYNAGDVLMVRAVWVNYTQTDNLQTVGFVLRYTITL